MVFDVNKTTLYNNRYYPKKVLKEALNKEGFKEALNCKSIRLFRDWEDLDYLPLDKCVGVLKGYRWDGPKLFATFVIINDKDLDFNDDLRVFACGYGDFDNYGNSAVLSFTITVENLYIHTMEYKGLTGYRRAKVYHKCIAGQPCPGNDI